MKSFAVIGLGLFGTQVAKDLYDEGNDVLAIDISDENVENIADYVTQAVTLDATNRNSLLNIGIDKYDSVILAIAGDLATAVLITMNLKALGVPQIVCKAQSETDKEVLETLGANSCLIPEHMAATRLAKVLTGRNVIDFTQLSEDHSILEIAVPLSWIGKSVRSLNVRAQHGINIAAIRRGGSVLVDFDPSVPFSDGDELIIIGSNKNLDKIQKIK